MKAQTNHSFTSPMLLYVSDSALLLLARIALASVFWLSGQTKIDGFAINIVSGQFMFGWPEIKDATFYLFENEYQLPFIPYELAAYLAATAEHIFPVMLLLGLGTRIASLGLLVMTMTIQIFVYPDAYSTHLTWMALCTLLILKGAGWLSLDKLIAERMSK